MKKLNKEDVKVGDEIWVRGIVESTKQIRSSLYGDMEQSSIKVLSSDIYLEEKDDWIPYVEDDFNMLGCTTVSIVQFENGDFELYHLGSSVSRTDIVAYKIITPYTFSRRKVVVKDSLELHKLILEHGKLYYSLELGEYVTYEGGFVKYVGEWGGLTCYNFDDWDKREWWVE